MKIFDRFKSLKKSANTELSNDNHWIVLGGGTDSINDANLLINNKEWVYIATDKIARSVASVRFKVMKYSRAADDQEVFEGPMVDFLEKPGIGFTGKDFIYLNTVYKEISGNAFWNILAGNKVTPLIPTSVSPVVENGKLVGYRTGGSVYGLKSVLHDRYIDPARPYWGVGKLAKIAKWVDTSAFANDILRSFFLNGAVFGGFIMTDEDSSERIKLIRAGLQNDHTGTANAHKLGILPKGTKYQPTATKMSDMEMGTTDDRYRDKILAAFGVPKTLVGLTTEVNRATAEAAEYTFAKYTVKPIVDDFVEFLNVYVAPMLDNTGAFYFAYDDFVPANRELILTERKLAIGGKQYKTINEVRAEEGLPPVKGGDEIQSQEPAPSPDQKPNGNNNNDGDVPKPKKDFEKRNVPYGVRKAVAIKDNKETAVKSLDTALEKLFSLERDAPADRILDDEAAHKEFVGRVDGYREQLETAVVNFNSRQGRQVLLDLASITKGVNPKDIFNMDEEIDLMVDVVTPIFTGLLTEQAIEEFTAQAFDGTFDSGAVLVKRVIQTASRRLAETYNSTTVELLKDSLDKGIAAGEGLAALTKRVQSVYEYSDRVRAKSVAHTESFYIANKANEVAYQQSGVVKSKRWYTALDERVCEFCGPMNGRTIGIDEVFFKKGETYEVLSVDRYGESKVLSMKMDYRTMDVPPLHTNCRCFLRPANISIAD